MARKKPKYVKPDPERARYTVQVDKWDQEDIDVIKRDVKQVNAAQDALGEITPTARPEASDALLLFLKAAPDLKDESDIRDDHRLNLVVNKQMIDTPEYRQLRRFTRGDKVGSAMAFVQIEPQLEELFDRNKHLQQAYEELQKLKDELRDRLREKIRLQQEMEKNKPKPEDGEQEGEPQQGEGQGEGQDESEGQGQGQGQPGGQGQQPGDGQGGQPSDQQGDQQGQGQPTPEEQLANVQQQIESLQRAIEALENSTVKLVEQESNGMGASLSAALGDAAEDARQEQESARAWGLDPGQLTRLPAKERIELAKKWNKPRLRQIAEYFGRLRNLAFSPVMRTVPDVPHEVTGMKFSDDIGSMLPEEMLRLSDSRTKKEFLADYAEGRIRTYKFQGKQKIGKGGIILCEDGSASMRGEREMVAKAIMLVLLNLAKRDGRYFHLIHFGGPGQFRTISFTEPSDFSTDNIIDAAEMFFNGGTDFETPLNEAMRLVEVEHRKTGRVMSDIVMLTDGECGVGEPWLKRFHEQLDEHKANAYGINVAGESWGDTLDKICRDLVLTLSDLSMDGTNGGKDLTKLFAAVQKPVFES